MDGERYKISCPPKILVIGQPLLFWKAADVNQPVGAQKSSNSSELIVKPQQMLVSYFMIQQLYGTF